MLRTNYTDKRFFVDIYWLCNDENDGTGNPVGYYTSKPRILEAMAIAVAMGGNTVCSLMISYSSLD